MAEYFLHPPTVREPPMALNRLHERFPLTHGVAILQRQDLSFYTSRAPAQTELEEARRSWLGGYVHQITEADALALIEAGFGEYVEATDTSYGLLPYGAGPYGG